MATLAEIKTQLIPNVKKFINNNGSFVLVIIIFLAFVPIIPLAIYKAIYESFFMLGVIFLLLPFIYVICNLYDKLSYLRRRYREQREQVLSLYENIDTIEEWVKDMRRVRYGDNLTAKFTFEDLTLFLHDPRREHDRFRMSISGEKDNIPEISNEKKEKLREEFNYLINSRFNWGVYEKEEYRKTKERTKK